MIKWLTEGKWERPTDKMAVYTEIQRGQRWGIRVTLLSADARVEAIDGPRCTWYKVPYRLRGEVKPPNIWEKIRGVTFDDKLRKEVAAKRAVAAEENGRSRLVGN